MRTEIFQRDVSYLRVVTFDEMTPWFSAKDVALALGYGKASNAVYRHVDAEDRMIVNYTDYKNTPLCTTLWQGSDRANKVLINEAGMYSMIFSSKLDSAHEFKRWIASKVLPSIRQYGGYVLKEEFLEEEERERLHQKIQEEYEVVKTTLQRRTTRWHAACQKRDELKAKNADLRKEIRALRSELENASTTVEDETRDIIQMRTERWHAACHKRDELKAKNVLLSKEVRVLRKEANDWFDEYAKILNENSEIYAENAVLRERLREYARSAKLGTVQAEAAAEAPQKICVNKWGFIV